jgi:hypothetical protein
MKKSILILKIKSVMTITITFLLINSLCITNNFSQSLNHTISPDGRYEYYDNGNIKIGFDKMMGGAISHFSKIGQSNLVNNHDAGRQVGLDPYWGPQGNVYCPTISSNCDNEYEKVPSNSNVKWNGIPQGSWKYNPNTGTNQHLGGTALIGPTDIGGNEVYIKSTLWDWGIIRKTPSEKVDAHAFSETWIKFTDNGARVKIKLTRDLNSINVDVNVHGGPLSLQMGRYFYGNRNQKNLYYYNGSNPWQNGGLTAITEQQLLSSPGGTIGLHDLYTKENWVAFLESNENSYGYGIFAENQPNGSFVNTIDGPFSNDEFGFPSSFSAYVTLHAGNVSVTEVESHIIAGNVSQIRQYVYGIHNGGGCTPPTAPSITSNSVTAPANLTATGCSGAVKWSNNSIGTPLNGVGVGTYTATCTVNNCTSDASNSITISSSTGTCVSCNGFFDEANCIELRGWVWDASSPNAFQTVSVYEGSNLITTAVASAYRSDLQNAGIGNGQHAFNIPVPSSLKNNTLHTLTLKVGNYFLNTNYKSITCAGCTPPTAPSITSNLTTAPANLTATGCSGAVKWSNNSTGTPLNGVGAGTYTATCTVNNCTSDASNSITISSNSPTSCTLPSTNCIGCQGHFDLLDCNSIQGWVWGSGNQGTRQVVQVYEGSTWITCAEASNYRSDLQGAGIGDGKYAFYIPLPSSLKNGVSHTLTLKVGSYFLNDNNKSITCASGTRIATNFSEFSDEKIIVYPNPTHDSFKVSFSLQNDESVWLNLYDTVGKSLQIRDFQGKAGNNLVEFDLSKYPSGNYFINLQSLQRRETQKIIKTN